tara:strand:- start:27 stop:527 length:501 start_codon:yes stop_codon:yes gene_type:complete
MSEEELKQCGGDGYFFNMGENVGGLPAVEGYNCCDGAAPPTAPADATNQVGGGVNPFNFIINPETGARMSLFSSGGKSLLKNLIKLYKTGGNEIGEDESNATLHQGNNTPHGDADANNDGEHHQEDDCEKDPNKEGCYHGGAPAELPGAFGEDYFNTEADALKGEW